MPGMHHPVASLQIQLAPTARAAAQARAAVGDWLHGHRAGATVVEIVLVVVSELVTNSVRHAASSVDAGLRLSAEVRAGAVRVEVHDGGTAGTVALRPSETTGDHIGGYGLQLVDSLSTAWGVERDEHGTVVWAQLPL